MAGGANGRRPLLRVVAVAMACLSVSTGMCAPLPASAVPLISYLSYVGGTGDDHPLMAATDAAGNVHTSGWTTSVDFVTAAPVRSSLKGERDGYVSASRPNGSLIYSTYIGGSGIDSAWYLRVGPDGTAYVVGSTSSVDFPVTGDAAQRSFGGGTYDGFLAILDPTGRVQYATYIGGRAYDSANLISLDLAAGAVYVVGNTRSANFRTTPGAFQEQPAKGTDGWVMRIDASTHVLRWSTLLGASGSDAPYGVQTDPSGNAVVATLSTSADFPVTQGPGYVPGGDTTLTVFTRTGAVTWSRFYGQGRPNGVEIDLAGNVVVVGRTATAAYVASFDPAGTPRFSTLLGTSADWFGGTAVDGSGLVWAVGGAREGLPTPGGSPPTPGGGQDAYAAAFGADGRLLFATYLGGSKLDGFTGVASVGPTVWIVGRTDSSGIPTTARAQQPTQIGGGDGLLLHLAPASTSAS